MPCLLFSQAAVVLIQQPWSSNQGPSARMTMRLDEMLGGITLHLKTPALLQAIAALPESVCLQVVTAMLDWPLPDDGVEDEKARRNSASGLRRSWAQLRLHLDKVTCDHLLLRSVDYLHSPEKHTRQQALHTLLPTLVRRVRGMSSQSDLWGTLPKACSECWDLCRSEPHSFLCIWGRSPHVCLPGLRSTCCPPPPLVTDPVCVVMQSPAAAHWLAPAGRPGLASSGRASVGSHGRAGAGVVPPAAHPCHSARVLKVDAGLHL